MGPNTSGKTNLLEAIYSLSTGKSFRAEVEREMISYGEEISRVCAVVGQQNFDSTSDSLAKGSLLDNDNQPRSQGETSQNLMSSQHKAEDIKLEIILTVGQLIGEKSPKKKFLVNGVARRLMDFVGSLNCVLFRPEDLEIIIDSPSIRRNYLDSVLEPVDREYRRASLSYKKGLRQRNKLLEQIREEGKPRSVLFFWDKLLIENGTIITQKRQEFIRFVNQQPDYFGNLEIEYDQSIISPQRLEKYADEEVAAGMTLVGPHRDDMKFKIRSEKHLGRWHAEGHDSSEVEGIKTARDLSAYGSRGEPRKSRDLSIYGSRGEQRTAVFSLKLAELAFVNQKIGQSPVLLLDDIFSELDNEHRKRLLEVIPHQQTIITTTDLHLIEPEQRKKMEIINLGA